MNTQPTNVRTGEILEPPRFGSVIVFRKGMTRTASEAILKELIDRKLLDLTSCMHPNPAGQVHEFDGNTTGPVWYIP